MTSRTYSSVSKLKHTKNLFYVLVLVLILLDVNLIVVVAVGESFLPIAGADVALLRMFAGLAGLNSNIIHAQLFPGAVGGIESHDSE